MKRLFLVVLLVLILVGAMGAVTIADICKSKDVMALLYYHKVTLMNLQTGDEVDLYSEDQYLDCVWGKSGNKLYVLSSVHTDGVEYDDVGYETLYLREITLPAATVKVITSFKPKMEMEDLSYSYCNLYLTKTGNPDIEVTYGVTDEEIKFHYIYNLSTLKLGAPVKKRFDCYKDGYIPAGIPKVVTEAPGLYSSEYMGRNNLFSSRVIMDGLPLTDIEKLQWGTIAVDEPVKFCVSKDSTRVLFTYTTEDEIPYGPTYSMTIDGEKTTLLSFTDVLGYNYIPGWMSDNRIAYLYIGATTYDHEIPAVKIIELNGDCTVLKTYDEESGTDKGLYRYTK